MTQRSPIRPTALTFFAAVTVAATTMSTSAVYAAELVTADMSPEVVLEEIAPETLISVAAPDTGPEGIELVVNEVSTSIPTDASDGIEFESNEGALTVSLPFAEDAEQIPTVIDGMVAFDNGNGSQTASVLKDDGGVQINTIIEGPGAPTRYDYELAIPDGATITQNDDGSILISDKDGYALSSIDPAWAKDANGASIETWYEVKGTTLTQVVAHSSGDAYPIVADPSINVYWWGIGIKFTKAETKKIAAASSNAGALTVACGLIANAPGAVACGAAGFVLSALGRDWAKGVASRGKCIQLSQTWATGLPAVPVEVKC
ncbi:hypothetical protein [Leucobacter triazinivorans]|uniref:Uncharacterized protein n=1 Tax=Leucobacter triazinivorans TaxID=1784719 RepID=A0A4P6KF38_9MICO|nr:hypothetical protein [Leucobacter triazinivorans]QBE49026.1 hypothetical protein EVS81_09385 [Leucobacter triazinivorans]